MPSDRSSKDRSSSFETAKVQLLRELGTAQRKIGEAPNSSTLAQVPYDVFEEYDELVETLFSQGKEFWTARQLRKLVLGQRVLDSRRPRRAQVLATLLFIDVKKDSVAWASFLEHLTLEGDSGERPSLIDENLPLDEDALSSALVEKKAAKQFLKEQSNYSEANQPRFRDLRRKFVELLDKIYKSCPGSSGVFNDGFYPDAELYEFFDEHATGDYLKDLHLETEKWKGREEPRDVRDRSMKTAREQSGEFLRGLRPRRKIMAALLKSDAQVHSKAWQRFVMTCLGREEWAPDLLDEKLPISVEKAKELFAEDNNDAFLHDFGMRQYEFCAVKLVSEKMINRREDDKYHLPILSLRQIGEGSMGKVYSVKVKGGYLEKDDVEIAMKRMSKDKSNEWERVSWLYEQQMSDKHILKPTANVNIGEVIFLFLEQATYGDLTQYFENHYPAGPSEHQERMAFLGSMYSLAVAVSYLQNSVERQYGHEKRKVSCIHKDLKGPNILVFENLQLKITDFGISSIVVEGVEGNSDRSSEGSKPLSLSKRGTEAEGPSWSSHYPPEAELTGEVNVKCDVWSLGTVFAECVAWMSGGDAARQELRKCIEGKYHVRPKEGVASLKPAVRQFFESAFQSAQSARADEAGKDARFFECCWRLLSDKMLVCDPERRSSISEVVDCLRKILARKAVDEIFPPPPIRACSDEGANGNGEASRAQLVQERSSDTPRSTQQGRSVPKSHHARVTSDHVSDDGDRPSPTRPASSQAEKLIAAVQKGNLSEVESLLQSGADAKATGKGFWTALHHSVHEPHRGRRPDSLQITKRLVEAEPALVHMRTDDMRTPMHIIAKFGSPQQADVLWQCSQRPDLQATAFGLTPLGLTPLDVAKQCKRIDMVDWIEKRLKEQESARHIETT